MELIKIYDYIKMSWLSKGVERNLNHLMASPIYETRRFRSGLRNSDQVF